MRLIIEATAQEGPDRFWIALGHGYTRYLEEATKFTPEEAARIISSDMGGQYKAYEYGMILANSFFELRTVVKINRGN